MGSRLGPDGNIWFTDQTLGKLRWVTPAPTSSIAGSASVFDGAGPGERPFSNFQSQCKLVEPCCRIHV